ncbi:MAG: FHA domain-containing protein [Deltaproteobacteria bacterium]|nr:FHA domain-containing protein [Deltaproteobacteria bacterium]MBW2253309.1 FHA domain-containing protein [Deltaproteobacteria bacterium]
MATAQTYLQLSPEFGGTKFGPFKGVEIRLGSDPSRNDIVLPEALGVSPAHVRIVMQKDGTYIVAPTERTATVYLWRADGRPAKLITTPTAVHAGDGFSVVTAEGPRFYILLEQPKKGAGGQDDAVAPPDDKKSDLGGGVIAEMKRLGLAKFMTTGIGNFFQTAFMMVKTGTIFSPRYIVMGMMMIVPLIMAGGAGCAALSFKFKSDKQGGEIDELKSDLEACGAGDQGGDPTVGSLTQAILGDREWQQSLETDPDFNGRYLKRLKTIFERSDRYQWVYKRKASDFTKLQGRMDKEMGPALTRVFAYIAAHPGYVSDRQWGLIRSNSEGTRTCGRGPALITYRQSVNLDIAAEPDALVDAGIAASDDLDLKAAQIRATMGSDDREFENEEIQAEGAGLQGGFQCLYLEGDDEREDPKALAKALGRALGPDVSKRIPEEGRDSWITARLVKFYAADFILGYEDLDLTGIPSVALDEMGPSQKEFALQNAADVTARSVAIPCLAILDEVPADHLGQAPTLVQCGVLNLLVLRSGK